MEYLTLGNALNIAIVLAGGFGWRWIDRLEKRQDALAASISQESKDRGTFEKKVLEEYAKKGDVAGARDLVLAQYQELSRKVDKIFDKLDGKKDKNDG